MCELLSVSYKEPQDIKKELYSFFEHSVHHPHGWGMMRITKGKYEVIKEPVRAKDSLVLPDVVEGTEKQTTALAHIRLATVGATKIVNCHPYYGKDVSGRTWTLIHNGTIYSSRELMNYLNVQKGDTDSERVFLHLLCKINECYEIYDEVTEEIRFSIVEKLVCELSKRNKLNLMIFDGDILYVHKNMKDTLYEKETDNGFIFSTTMLGDGWKEFPICRLKAYKKGELIFEGKEQTSEFVPTLEYISALAALNI